MSKKQEIKKAYCCENCRFANKGKASIKCMKSKEIVGGNMVCNNFEMEQEAICK